MKREKTKRAPLTEVERWANQVQAYRLPNGLFDYAVRAQATVEAKELFQKVADSCRRSHADSDADTVIEAARRLYYAALEQAYPPGF